MKIEAQALDFEQEMWARRFMATLSMSPENCSRSSGKVQYTRIKRGSKRMSGRICPQLQHLYSPFYATSRGHLDVLPAALQYLAAILPLGETNSLGPGHSQDVYGVTNGSMSAKSCWKSGARIEK